MARYYDRTQKIYIFTNDEDSDTCPHKLRVNGVCMNCGKTITAKLV